MTIRLLFAAFFAAVSVIPCSIAAQTGTEPAVKAFFGVPALSGVVISPSGDHLALRVRNASGHIALAIAESGNLKKTTTLANFRNMDVISVEWINSDRLLYRTADQQGDVFGVSTFAVNRDGTRERRLQLGRARILGAKGDGSSHVIMQEYLVNHLDWSSDSSKLYSLDTLDESSYPMTTGTQPPHIRSWIVGVDGAVKYVICSWKGKRSVYRWSDEQWTKVSEHDMYKGVGVTPISVGVDGNVYGVIERSSGTTALHLLDPVTLRPAAEPFVEIEGFDFDGHPVFDAKTRKLLGVRHLSDAWGTTWVDPHMVDIQRRIDEKLPQTINTVRCGDCASTPVYLVESVSDRQPEQYLLFDPKTDHLTALGSVRPDIEPERVGTREFSRFKASDGMSIPVYVTRPAGGGVGPHPAVVLVHGGPWARGATWEWSDDAQFFASRGYLVIEPEFRGSTGFGFAHFKAGWKEWGKAMQRDLADAANWAIAQGMADPTRVCIAGASYGGYAVLMGLAQNPELFRCGVEWLGVTDITYMFRYTLSNMSDEAREYGLPVLVGDPDSEKDTLISMSPVSVAEKIHQPLLMAYGGADGRVPVDHGNALRSAIRGVNDKVEWLFYADEGHGWFHEPVRVDFWSRVEKFLDQNLRGTPNAGAH